MGMQGAKPLAIIYNDSPPSRREGGRGDGDKKYRYTIGKEGIARKAGVCYLNCNFSVTVQMVHICATAPQEQESRLRLGESLDEGGIFHMASIPNRLRVPPMGQVRLWRRL